VLPTIIVAEGGATETVATGTGITVMELVPLCPSLVAVIVTGPPTPTAVTRPLPSTVAIEGVAEVHTTVRPVRTLLPASRSVAPSCWVAPTTIVAVGGVTLTVATGTGLTVIVVVVAGGADSLVAVIVAVPGARAVMVIVAPLAPLTELAPLTLSTEELLEAHPTVRPLSAAPPPSRGVAVST